jgi:hypothetical protein
LRASRSLHLTAAYNAAAVSGAKLPICRMSQIRLWAVSPAQREIVLSHFDRFARESRSIGVSDQDVAEFMLQVGGRWLQAHGVSAANIHSWIDASLRKPAPLPLTAAARSRNDFGASR